MQRTYQLLGTLLLLIAVLTPESALAGGNPGYKVKFQVPAGSNTVSYAAASAPDELNWGPTALTVAPDGTYWIANSDVDKLTHLGADGTVLGTLDLTKYQVVGISDLKATPSGLYALDAGSPVIKVLRLGYDGTLIASQPVPSSLARFVTGIVVGAQGEIVLEVRGLARYRLFDSSGNPSPASVSGLVVNSQSIRVQPSVVSTPRTGHITVGTTTWAVRVPNYLAGVRVLGLNPASTAPGGSFYLLVDELAPDSNGVFRIDQVVREYSSAGRLLGLARFPIAEQYAGVTHPLAIAPDGSVYGLITRSDGAQVIKLTFAPTLAPILPVGAVTTGSPGTTYGARISRDTIASNAWAYINHSSYLTATNVSGACSGRDKPHYLFGPGTYASVAYDWGGWDTVAGYDWYMGRGYQAGDSADTNTGMESCSRGVDCSGFVTRAWGRSDKKYVTATLPSISYGLWGPWSLRQGDVMNWPYEHVRLVSSVDGNGVTVWESTAWANTDRVIYRYVPWSSFMKYQPRRYKYLTNP